MVNVHQRTPQQQLIPQIDIALQGMQKGFPPAGSRAIIFPSCRNNRPSSIAGRAATSSGSLPRRRYQNAPHRGLVIHHRTCLLNALGIVINSKIGASLQPAAARRRGRRKVTLLPPRRSGRRLSPALRARREPASGGGGAEEDADKPAEVRHFMQGRYKLIISPGPPTAAGRQSLSG